jgi:hypothetical protein
MFHGGVTTTSFAQSAKRDQLNQRYYRTLRAVG